MRYSEMKARENQRFWYQIQSTGTRQPLPPSPARRWFLIAAALLGGVLIWVLV